MRSRQRCCCCCCCCCCYWYQRGEHKAGPQQRGERTVGPQQRGGRKAGPQQQEEHREGPRQQEECMLARGLRLHHPTPKSCRTRRQRWARSTRTNPGSNRDHHSCRRRMGTTERRQKNVRNTAPAACTYLVHHSGVGGLAAIANGDASETVGAWVTSSVLLQNRVSFWISAGKQQDLQRSSWPRSDLTKTDKKHLAPGRMQREKTYKIARVVPLSARTSTSLIVRSTSGSTALFETHGRRGREQWDGSEGS